MGDQCLIHTPPPAPTEWEVENIFNNIWAYLHCHGLVHRKTFSNTCIKCWLIIIIIQLNQDFIFEGTKSRFKRIIIFLVKNIIIWFKHKKNKPNCLSSSGKELLLITYSRNTGFDLHGEQHLASAHV
jgi:hypothetical protein